ncbi:MAG: hypothetical protein ACRDJI_10880 [Actinomycetota bacterium]
MSLLGIGRAIEVFRGPPVVPHAETDLLRILADVDRYPKGVGSVLCGLDRTVDPTLPPTLAVDEHELRVVETDADDDGFDPLTACGDEVGGCPYVASGFGFALEGPRSLAHITSPPSTHKTWPVT